jgi:hypothetical protein
MVGTHYKKAYITAPEELNENITSITNFKWQFRPTEIQQIIISYVPTKRKKRVVYSRGL